MNRILLIFNVKAANIFEIARGWVRILGDNKGELGSLLWGTVLFRRFGGVCVPRLARKIHLGVEIPNSGKQHRRESVFYPNGEELDSAKQQPFPREKDRESEPS